MSFFLVAILPESIGGRLTLSSLVDGFVKLGYSVYVVDPLLENYDKNIIELQGKKFNYLLGYDYSAIKVKEFLNIDCPTINYFSDVIDTDLSGKDWPLYYKSLENTCNWSFCWDYELTQYYKEKNLNVFYLPHAVNTDIYKPSTLQVTSDIMFAGRLNFEGRMEKVLYLIETFPDLRFAIYSYRKHFDSALKSIENNLSSKLESFYNGFIQSEVEMACAINSSKIVLNFHSQGVGALNYRVFQALSSGKLLLTDYRKELTTLFYPGKDIIYYEDMDDLVLKIRYYLSSPQKYQEIIENGRRRILDHYDSVFAVQNILSIIGG